MTDCPRDVHRVARQMLNKSLGDKLISKQECMVQMAGLDLFACSKMISSVSLSRLVLTTIACHLARLRADHCHCILHSHRKLMTNGVNEERTTLKLYSNQSKSKEHMSLNDFFICMNKPAEPGERQVIPHHTGSYCHPVCPPTEQFARAMLTIHKPWSKTNPLPTTNLIRHLNHFMISSSCPLLRV